FLYSFDLAYSLLSNARPRIHSAHGSNSGCQCDDDDSRSIPGNLSLAFDRHDVGHRGRVRHRCFARGHGPDPTRRLRDRQLQRQLRKIREREAARKMKAPVLVENLTKVFYDEGRGELKAVDGITFECREGEVFGLLGANGAGKTTTLRMLSTILAPTSGTATLMGHDVAANPEGVRKNLGFYSATTALYPRLTTRETIEFFARINQYPADRVHERVDYLIQRFDLAKYADARIEKLSSGMKQKVSIARTIAHNPAILIFDEPTVGLDVLNALDVQETISELRSEGKTIIFSTH